MSPAEISVLINGEERRTVTALDEEWAAVRTPFGHAFAMGRIGRDQLREFIPTLVTRLPWIDAERVTIEQPRSTEPLPERQEDFVTGEGKVTIKARYTRR